MGYSIGIAILQFEDLCIYIPKNQTWKELPKFADSIIFLHEQRADDDGSKEIPIRSHFAASSKLPINGKDHSSRAIPAKVHTQQHSNKGQHTKYLKLIIKALNGQVGHEFVLPDDPCVVDDECCKACYERILDHRQVEEMSYCYMDYHHDWGQNDQSQFRIRNGWFAAKFFVLKLKSVSGRG